MTSRGSTGVSCDLGGKSAEGCGFSRDMHDFRWWRAGIPDSGAVILSEVQIGGAKVGGGAITAISGEEVHIHGGGDG